MSKISCFLRRFYRTLGLKLPQSFVDRESAQITASAYCWCKILSSLTSSYLKITGMVAGVMLLGAVLARHFQIPVQVVPMFYAFTQQRCSK